MPYVSRPFLPHARSFLAASGDGDESFTAAQKEKEVYEHDQVSPVREARSAHG